MADHTDLLSQIHGAQSDLDRLLSQLGSDAGSLLAEGLTKREMLAKLERTLTSGAPVPIASVRGEIAGLVASTAALAQQARATSDQSGGSALATAQARTRATVEQISRDLYERRIFDPYLHFSSAEDEAAYRHREEQDRRAIEDALAQGTPQGDLRAARIMDRQLQDAGAHGADASPDFARYLAQNRQNVGQLEHAMGSEQRPQERQPSASNPENAGSPSPSPSTDAELASVLATFRAAGIGGGVTAQDSGHGLNVDASSAATGRSVRT